MGLGLGHSVMQRVSSFTVAYIAMILDVQVFFTFLPIFSNENVCIGVRSNFILEGLSHLYLKKFYANLQNYLALLTPPCNS